VGATASLADDWLSAMKSKPKQKRPQPRPKLKVRRWLKLSANINVTTNRGMADAGVQDAKVGFISRRRNAGSKQTSEQRA